MTKAPKGAITETILEIVAKHFDMTETEVASYLVIAMMNSESEIAEPA